jgi:GNAT superfamily N-acetyltransferase
MSVIITRERPYTADAIALISELEAHLASLYPPESRHGFSVETLLAEDVPFFLLRYKETPAGCGGIKLFGIEYGEIKRMYVRPQFRSLGFGKLMLSQRHSFSMGFSQGAYVGSHTICNCGHFSNAACTSGWLWTDQLSCTMYTLLTPA